MKNWKTTLFGMIAAAGIWLNQSGVAETQGWKNIVASATALAVAAQGKAAQDAGKKPGG